MRPDGRFGDEQCESDLNIRSDAASPPLNGGQSRQGNPQSRQLDGMIRHDRQIETLLLRYAAFSKQYRFAFAS
jgi:hypothetical protein